MFLQQLPDALRWALLFVIGASLGALVNLAIYRLAHFVNRNVSPWSAPPDASRNRTFVDRLPVVGWFFLRRESDVYGKGHWIRPLLIELALGAGLAWFYHWNLEGGLIGGPDVNLIKDQASQFPAWAFSWFFFHSVLFALMVAATFIDFDEQMIPDWITVPGTVFALVCHSISPALRLPFTSHELLTTRLDWINFWSPDDVVNWHWGPYGVIVALAIVLVWAFALMPKWTTLRWGIGRGARIMIASILRPPRKTKGQIERIRPRKMLKETKALCWVALALVTLVIIMFFGASDQHWTSLFDSLLGLAMGGGIVWAVRIIAGKALGVEAMGFGDVTLMCMIGAFVGWQAALLAFIIAPFTSIVVALVQLIVSGENRLAFGPYLCLATSIVVIGWDRVWNQWAADGAFALGGSFLLGVILVCLVLMAIMLGAWGKFKYRND